MIKNLSKKTKPNYINEKKMRERERNQTQTIAVCNYIYKYMNCKNICFFFLCFCTEPRTRVREKLDCTVDIQITITD